MESAHDTRIITCRYLRRSGTQCTAEAVHPDGDILLCTEHLGLALAFLRTTPAAPLLTVQSVPR